MVTYKKKVIGYVRVSTEEQAKNGTSIETQCERIRAYCVAFNLELIDIVIEPAMSGASMEKRKKLQGIRDRVGNGEFDAIIAIKVDRIARNLKELMMLVEDELEPNNCDLILMDVNVDTSTPVGKVILQILGSFAQFERAMIAERTMTGIDHRAHLGKHATGNVPTGYKSIDVNGKRELRVDKDSEGLEVVKTIFRLRDQEDMTYTAIADYLNDNGYRPKNWKPEKQTKFYNSSVQTIYKNPKYQGIYTFNRRGEDTIVVKNEDLKVVLV